MLMAHPPCMQVAPSLGDEREVVDSFWVTPYFGNSLHAGGSFVGGGTGFWAKGTGSHEREVVDSLLGNSLFGNSLWEEPVVVLAPNAGTAFL